MEIIFREEDHTYWVEGRRVLSVTQILSEAGLVDSSFYTEESRIRGTAVHNACHFLDENDLDWNSVEEAYKPYIAAYQAFLEDFSPVWTNIEKKVYNSVYNYTGRYDRYGFLNGSYYYVDLKTGSMPKTCGLQLAGYQMAENNMTDVKRLGLQLCDDGNYKLHEFNNRSDYAVFKSASVVANWKLNNKMIKE